MSTFAKCGICHASFDTVAEVLAHKAAMHPGTVDPAWATTPSAAPLASVPAEAVPVAPAPDATTGAAPAKRKRAPKGSRPPRPPSRTQRWQDAASKLKDAISVLTAACDELETAASDLRSVQEEYEEWKDNLPDNMQSGTVADKLETVCSISVEDMAQTVRDAIDEADGIADEAENAELPLGFGRD